MNNADYYFICGDYLKDDTFFDLEKWMLVDVVWRRYTWLDTCDLQWRGGLGDITEVKYLDSLVLLGGKQILPHSIYQSYFKRVFIRWRHGRSF